jgi:hypothetical protein
MPEAPRALSIHRFAIYGGSDRAELLAQALVVPEVKYAAILWGSTSRLERPFVTENLWHSFRNEAAALTVGVTLTISAAGLMLLGPRANAAQLRYQGCDNLELGRSDVPTWLDRRLRDLRLPR